MMRSQIQRAIYFAGLAALAVIVSAGAATATTINVFSNFSGTPSFNDAGNYSMFTISSNGYIYANAMPFTAGSSVNLADAVLALESTGTDNSPMTLDLESDSSGAPGTILASLTQSGTIPTTPGLVTFNYSGPPSVELTSGTSYWLVALQTDHNSDDEWFSSNTDVGPVAYNHTGSATGPWGVQPGSSISAFEVDGNAAPTAASEPPLPLIIVADFLLFGLALEFLRRRGVLTLNQ